MPDNLPRTFDVRVKRPDVIVAARHYTFSVHAADHSACLDEVVKTFPGVDVKALRALYAGERRPAVGIIDTDSYTGKVGGVSVARRKTAAECLASIALASAAITRDLGEVMTALASYERRDAPPPASLTSARDKLVVWSCRITYKVMGMALTPPRPVTRVVNSETGEVMLHDGGGAELSAPEPKAPRVDDDDADTWGQPLSLSQIKF